MTSAHAVPSVRPASLHPLTWVSWAGAALTLLSLTRNPVYLMLILGWLALTLHFLSRQPHSPALLFSPWRFMALAMVLSGLFNGLFVHIGALILFRLPESWPLIGGPITGEAVFYGVLNGVSLGGILAAFAALNQALPVRSLVRLIPRAFYPVAVVTAIAVTFVPTTLRQYEQIREAQAVRGHRLSGWRDWLPLLLPLLIGGLERALQLAEAMVARGFASPAEESLSLGVRAGLGLGLLSFGGGWLLRLVWGVSLWGWLGLVLGAGLIGLSLWQAGRRVPRTTYRPTRWTSADTLVAGAAFLAVAGFLWPWLNRASIFYYPYPRLIWPEVHPVLILATLGLLGPVGWLVFEPFKIHIRPYK